MQILYKEMIMTSDVPWGFIIAVVVIAFVFAILDFVLFKTNCYVAFISLCLGFLIILTGSGLIMGYNEYETGRYKYEVILDDDYPACNLYEKYNIVEQRGEIWVIEDKEPEFDKN